MSGRSALLTTDKDGYLWVVAQSSCLLRETVSPADEIKYKRGDGGLKTRVEEKRSGKVINVNEFVFDEICCGNIVRMQLD